MLCWLGALSSHVNLATLSSQRSACVRRLDWRCQLLVYLLNIEILEIWVHHKVGAIVSYLVVIALLMEVGVIVMSADARLKGHMLVLRKRRLAPQPHSSD